MPLSRVYLGPDHKQSTYKIIGIFKILINMALGLVMHGSVSKTLEQPPCCITGYRRDPRAFSLWLKALNSA